MKRSKRVFPGILAKSRAMKDVLALVEYARSSSVPVLLTGETGTGKEVLARAVHFAEEGEKRPFIAINCAAIPESLLDSELFGHARGSFTGADRDRMGVFEAANGGTLFLDEIGEAPLGFQAKLLRVLQEKELVRVGEHRSRPIDVRLIAATNRDLPSEIDAGNFRRDLYYRIAVFPIEVPPLRERTEDILLLAEHFLRTYASASGRPPCALSPESKDLLLRYPWPGNVRELQNETQRILALSPQHAVIETLRLSPAIRDNFDPTQARKESRGCLKARLDQHEAWILRCELNRAGGNRARTARHLGITREGLYKKMKRLGVT